MCQLLTRIYYKTTADAKLVRKSFLGVSPNTWNLKTYLLQSSSDLRYFGTIGDNCIPVELLKTSTKIPQPGNPFCLSYLLSICGTRTIRGHRVNSSKIYYDIYFISIKMVSICGCSIT